MQYGICPSANIMTASPKIIAFCSVSSGKIVVLKLRPTPKTIPENTATKD
jgi:hypothetical protein